MLQDNVHSRKCADENHTINEAYHLMASQPSLRLTDKVLAKCHWREQCAREIRAGEISDPQLHWSVITDDSRPESLLKTPPEI